MRDVLYAVYGASGFGREVMPLASAQLRARGVPEERLVFVDDAAVEGQRLNGRRVMRYEAFLAEPAAFRFATLAIANDVVREKLADRLEADGVQPWSITADNVVVLDDVEVGEGVLLCPFVMLTSNIRIGRHFHANIYSYVAHDCVIGDFVTFAPAVKCNGNGNVATGGRLGQPIRIGQYRMAVAGRHGRVVIDKHQFVGLV